MNALTVSEFFVFIIIIIIILLILICWKIYLFEKKRPNPPPVDIKPVLANVENLSKQIGDCIGKLEAVSAKSDPIQAIQKSVGELSAKISNLPDQTDESIKQNIQIIQATLDALSSGIESLSGKLEKNQKIHQEHFADISRMLEKMMQRTPAVSQAPAEKSTPSENSPLPPSESSPEKKQTAPLSEDDVKKQVGKETAETTPPAGAAPEKPVLPNPESVPATVTDAPEKNKTAEDETEKRKKELLAKI